MDENLELISARDASKLLHCSYETALKLIRTGELRGRKIAGKYFTVRAALVEYINTPYKPEVRPAAPVRVRPVQTGIDLRRSRKKTIT